MNKIEIFDCVCRNLCLYFVFCILLCIINIDDEHRLQHHSNTTDSEKMLSGNLCQYFNTVNIISNMFKQQQKISSSE